MASMTIIPQDVISTHILRHLPAKSVGRFRCVSKEWLSLLSDPRFIETHQKMLNRYHYIIASKDASLYSVPFYNHEASSTQTKLDLEFYQIDYIFGSVNGLVLAYANKKLHNNDYVFLVLNPTTKDYVEFPLSGEQFIVGMKGFGYDSVSDDYKFVHISRFNSYVNVYSLRTKTLKMVSYSPNYYYHYNSLGVFVNGFLHWIVESSSKRVIVAFSLADENVVLWIQTCR